MAYHRRRMGLMGVRELGWRDRESQRVRFEVLCRWGNLDGLAVVDLGCGLGDFATYVHGRYSGIRYLGVDLVPEFVERAVERHGGGEWTEFLVMDFVGEELPGGDWIVASGSLNYHTEDPGFPKAVILRMWKAARVGIAFNLLDEGQFEPGNQLKAYDPAEIHDFCLGLDPKAELVQGYHPDDFTILMRR